MTVGTAPSIRPASLQGLACCWIGSARYSQPLDPTNDKKWQSLGGLGLQMSVIGFASGLRPRVFTQHARFYLLPQLPAAPLRYLLSLACMPPLSLWLVLRHDARALIAQSPQEGALAALAKIAARLCGRRVALIVESHGDFAENLFLYRRVPLAGAVRWLIRMSAAFGLRHADALRAISASTRRQLEAAAPGRPIEQFMAWTDTRAFLEAARDAPPSRSHTILFAGALTPIKGVHHLLDAFAAVRASHPEARLQLAGRPQNAEYVAQLRQQIGRLELANRVDFLGELPQAELARHMAGARALVLPSLSEGLGRVIVEAMLCGAPAIASRVGGIPDMVRDGETGYLVSPGDAAALADALAKALDDPNIDRMSASARAFAREFFSPAAYVEAHRRLIEAALSAASLPTAVTPQASG